MNLPADPAMLQSALQHFEATRFAEAETVCEAILASAPNDFWTLRLLGELHKKQGADARASHFLERALAAGAPDEVIAVAMMNDLVTTLARERDYAKAVEWSRFVLERTPDDADALQKCAYSLVALNRHAEALPLYRAARAINPDSDLLKINEGMAFIGAGEWPAGWVHYEARMALPDLFEPDPFAQQLPRWRGDTDISGKTILLQAEQGLGDTLQFVRFVPQVAARGARVIVRVQPLLGRLLQALPGADQVVTLAERPEADMQCLLMSLPAIFGTTSATLPAAVPYIYTPLEYRIIWQALLGPAARKRIGIAWWGKQHIPGRSMQLATLAPLLARRDFEFHTLQIDIPDGDRVWLAANPQVVDHSAELKDFADTAALASLMDLVITIDTSVAHLSGALGLPTWIMLPFSADCKWLVDRVDTPWYPTARLFRQRRQGEWDAVVAAVMDALP